MAFFKKYIGDLFLTQRFYMLVIGCVILYFAGFFYKPLEKITDYLLVVSAIVLFTDYFLLFILGVSPSVERRVNSRLSNGDEAEVKLNIRNQNNFKVAMQVIDELPEQLQERNFKLLNQFGVKEKKLLKYSIRPVERGNYAFGNTKLYVETLLPGLLSRRFSIDNERTVQVLPAFTSLRNQHISSNATPIQGGANRRVRRIGQSMEFEQIKDYVIGDDIRNINWKATARRQSLMVNHYIDEKSQQVYAIIDKGRLMKMPFNRLSLLDYAINSTLALGNVCIDKQDRFGLITFAERWGTLLAADRKPIQKDNLMQTLFNEKTGFSESDFEALYMQIRHKIKQRSLLILFTNFETLNGLKRQIPYLRSIARHHLLLVVFFENTELSKLAATEVDNIEDIYTKTITARLVHEKRLIVKELQQYGIMSVLTTPEGLTANTISKYLEIKNRRLI